MSEVMEKYVKEYAMEASIKSAVTTCKDCGNTVEKAISIIVTRFGVSHEVAAQKVEQYWDD